MADLTPVDGVQVGRLDRWRLGLAAAAVLLAAADTYVVVVALPSMMTSVGVGLDRLQRATPIVSAFLLGYTAVLPLLGRIADLAGTEPVFAGCLIAFGTGSLITATAHALPVVVVGRAIQGIGGGGLVPVALAMVAARWPPDARGLPLGVVGAVQELGSVIGPLYGAAVLALASWRAIFWINLPITALVGAAFWVVTRIDRRHQVHAEDGLQARRRDVVGMALALIATAGLMVGLDAPASLATSTGFGQAYTPEVGGAWAPFTTPVVLASLGLLVGLALWELVAPAGIRPIVDLRRLPAILARADLPGALMLAGFLACVVVAFSTGDPSRQVVASSAPVVVPLAFVLAVAFGVRQRRASVPLIEPGAFAARPAWGALAVNLALGGALMSALIDVPLFARATVDPDSEVAAALVLLRFLAAVPIGAVIGGALCRDRSRAPVIAGAGMALATVCFVAMASWSAASLGGGPRPSDVELVLCGFGFGLAVAPVNVAILGAVDAGVHATASALAVVARTIGMLAGLSALTAIALHRFYEAQARIGSPLVVCANKGLTCPAYANATNRAIVSELHTIFAGAAVCSGAAAVLALGLLRPRAAAPLSADALDTTRSSGRRSWLGSAGRGRAGTARLAGARVGGHRYGTHRGRSVP